MSFDWLKIVDTMIANEGERTLEGYYEATFTSTQILEAVSGVITKANHRNVVRFVNAYYPESHCVPIGSTGLEGSTLYIRIRTNT